MIKIKILINKAKLFIFLKIIYLKMDNKYKKQKIMKTIQKIKMKSLIYQEIIQILKKK